MSLFPPDAKDAAGNFFSSGKPPALLLQLGSIRSTEKAVSRRKGGF